MVVQVDPAHVLLSGSQATANPHLERQEHGAQGSPRRSQDHSRPEGHHPDAPSPGRHGGGLPGPTDLREEALPGRGLLAEDLRPPVPVETHGGGRDQDARLPAQAGQSPGQDLRSLLPALHDGLLLVPGPPEAEDGLPGQVHHAVQHLQALGVHPSPFVVPEDVSLPFSPGDPQDRVSAGGQEVGEGLTDETGAPAHRHRQRFTLAVPGVEIQVVAEASMAEGEEALQLLLSESLSQDLARRPQGRLPLHLVFHDAAPVLRREEAVGMDPPLEGPRALLVPEELSLQEGRVLDLPLHLSRPLLDAQENPSAVVHASFPLQHPDGGPGRGQPLQGAGAPVPVEDLLHGIGEPGTVAEEGHEITP